MNRAEAEIKLKEWFGLPSFYNEQWQAIERLLNGERVLMIQRTGFGKSLVFQFAALVRPGVTVIFSPLIALMRDQVNKLQALGISAAYVNSSLTPEEKKEILRKAVNGEYDILYIAPERQEDQQWQETVEALDLSMVVIDEAHCISVWGHDFRPSFRRIVGLVDKLSMNFPVLACTATATTRVEKDIAAQLGARQIMTIRGDLSRPNFRLSAVRVDSQESKMAAVLKMVQNMEGTGLVYCGTRAQTEIFSNWLNYNGIKSTYYSGRLDDASRRQIEVGLMKNEYKCVVATNALGMGIDKADVRFILHTQIPTSPLHYYQEIGRAGRDGQPSTIALFYCDEDDELPEAFIRSSRPSISSYEKVIDELQEEALGLMALVRKVNLKQTAVNVILNDLIDQGIINKARYNSRTIYEYRFGAPDLNSNKFEELKKIKTSEFLKMKRYVDITDCRMNYLREYLGDKPESDCGNCDVDNNRRHTYSASPTDHALIQSFREEYFPLLEVESKTSIMRDGVAASFYGVSNVAQAINRSKYENAGPFPRFLVGLVIKAFKKNLRQQDYDIAFHVPPTVSGELVKEFAGRVSAILEIPLYSAIFQTRQIQVQKSFESGHGKRSNVKDAFGCSMHVKDKRILLIDDVFDSGHTVKEIGRMLKKEGATSVTPLCIAKTVGS